MTVGKLKRILSSCVEDLEMFPDDMDINLDSDTYNLVQKRNARNMLCVAGYDGGYADLDNITMHLEEFDEDDYE